MFADDVSGLDLDVAGITAVEAERTFWDKVVILHGNTARWFERRGPNSAAKGSVCSPPLL